MLTGNHRLPSSANAGHPLACNTLRRMLGGRRDGKRAFTRGIRALRTRVCVPWRDGAKAPPGRTWSSYGYETRASYSASGGWAETYVSASSNALLRKILRLNKPKVYRSRAVAAISLL